MTVTVPYTFQNTPNGTTIPLDKLDANFSALAAAINGPQTVSPSMLTTGGPVWNSTGDLTSQAKLISGNGNISSLIGPTNIFNIGLTSFKFNVGSVIPLTLDATGANVNGALTMNSYIGGALSGTLSLNAPQISTNTSFTFPIDMGSAGYVLSTNGAGVTSWVAQYANAVASFSGGTTGLTPSTPAGTGAVVLGGVLNAAHGGTGLIATPTAGQILIGNGTGFSLATLTQGTGCLITNAAGSITIAFDYQGSVVSSISGGSTGLTFTSPTGNVTMAGVLSVANGGTGAPNAQTALNTLVGSTDNNKVVKGNGANIVLAALTSADISAAGTLTNAIASTGAISATGNVTATANISAGGTVPATGNISTSGTITATSTATASDFLVGTTSIKSIGIGQTWQDLTSSRILNTTYTNTTGRPIMFSASLNYVSPGTVLVSIGGVTVCSFSNIGYTEGVSFIVPVGATYAVTITGGVVLLNWAELR